MEMVYTLYRVSTKKQVDKTKDDIPMQREACHEFADKMGRTIGKEFLEKDMRELLCRRLTEELSRLNVDFAVNEYDSGESFIDDHSKGIAFDMLFLDILDYKGRSST